jgi:hypothetical protein
MMNRRTHEMRPSVFGRLKPKIRIEIVLNGAIPCVRMMREKRRWQRGMNRRNVLLSGTALAAASAVASSAASQVAHGQEAQAPASIGKKTSILVIFGDDIGQSDLSACLMGYRTPNIDRIAKEGLMFMDKLKEPTDD